MGPDPGLSEVFTHPFIGTNPQVAATRRLAISPKATVKFLVFSALLAFVVTGRVSPGRALDLKKGAGILDGDQTPWQISARTLTYDDKQKIYTAEGDVVISKAGQSLYARQAVYNSLVGLAEVSGDVRLQMNGDLLTGDRGFFDLENQTGTIENGHLFIKENNVHIVGRIMEKTGPATYVISNCKVTTCDGDNPDWSLTGEEISVTVDGYGKLKNTAFRVKGLPVLYLPYFLFPANTKRKSGLLPPVLGFSDRNGFGVELPFFWAINERMDATFYQRYYSKRGYMQGLEYRYLVDNDSTGTLLFDILRDKKDKDMSDPDDLDVSPFERSNKTRYWLRGKADQDLPYDIVARVDADYVSDADYLREFHKNLLGYNPRPDLEDAYGRPLEDRRSPTRRSALRLSRDKGDVSVQVASSYNENPVDPDRDDTPQSLGAAAFSLLPKKIFKTPVYFGLESGYDYVWRDYGTSGHQFALYPEIKVPLWLGRYVEFEPYASYGINTRWFEEETGKRDHQNLNSYDLGARMLSQLERVYNADWGEVRRLKHRMWPALSYQYRRNRDPDAESPWFDPLSVTGDLNRLVFTIDNYVDARLEDDEGQVRYRQWVNFQLAQGYSLDEARKDDTSDEEKKPFEPLTAALILRPANYIDFYGVTKWDHYENELTETNVSCSFNVNRSGGRMDSFRVTYQDAADADNALNYWLRVNLAYGLAAGTSLRRNLDSKQTISNKYWLEFDSQCWGVMAGIGKEEADTTFLLAFRLLGLGEYGDW